MNLAYILVLMCVTLLACWNDMVISIFIICNLLKSWNYLLFLCDEVRLFMQFSGMLSGTGYPSGRIYPTGTGMELFFYPCAFAGNPTGKI
jgi:cytochrome b subunit of formate dehydrogenase